MSDLAENHDTDSLIVTVLESHFYLIVGPLKNEDGDSICEAKVTISLDDLDMINETDELGTVYFSLPRIHYNSDLEIKISREGYENLTYQTSIINGTLERSPPTLISLADPPEESPREENIEWYVYIAIILFVLILTGLIVYLIGRKSKEGLSEE